jgi:hypothetical protein
MSPVSVLPLEEGNNMSKDITQSNESKAIQSYLEDKRDHGMLWFLRFRATPLGNKNLSHVIDHLAYFYFETHAATFYKILLPQFRPRNPDSPLGMTIETQRWEGGKGFQHCEPFMCHDLPDNTVMAVGVTLKKP